MNRSIGLFILNIAVALYLLATGILGLTGRKYFPEGKVLEQYSIDTKFHCVFSYVKN